MLHPGIGDDHVEAAEALDGRLDRAPVALARGEIRGVGHTRRALLGIEVHSQHVEAVLLEPLGDRSADPARRAGHHGGASLA